MRLRNPVIRAQKLLTCTLDMAWHEMQYQCPFTAVYKWMLHNFQIVSLRWLETIMRRVNSPVLVFFMGR